MNIEELELELEAAAAACEQADLAYAEAINEYACTEHSQDHYHHTHQYKVAAAKAEKRYKELLAQLQNKKGILAPAEKVLEPVEDDDLPF